MTSAAGEQSQPPSGADLIAVAACLYCRSDAVARSFGGVKDFFFDADPGEFTYRRCGNCDSLWLAQRPVGQRLRDAYGAYYTHADPQNAASRQGSSPRTVLREAWVRQRFSASSSALDRIASAMVGLTGADMRNVEAQYRFAPKAPARLLDYGCGSGSYLLRMERFGHALHGAEFDPVLLESLSQRGIVVEDVGALRDDRWDAEFDHITLAHVLEHVADPLALLARLHGWLKPGASLYVEVPNGNATGLDIFGRYWRGLEAPRHFGLPGRGALMAAFAQAGLVVERQHVDVNARRWVWDMSLHAAPAQEQPALRDAMREAPAETPENAEFLTMVVRRPHAA